MKLKDRSHRDLGQWAFDTVNANAWPGAAEHLASTAADFTPVQEAKAVAAEAKDYETNTKGLGWMASIGKCNFADGVEGQRELPSHAEAMGACRNPVKMVSYRRTCWGGSGLKKAGAVCKGGIHFASGYLRSAIGATHHLNFDYLQSVAGGLNTLSGPWICAADFNWTPMELEATGWPRMVGE